jgi:hypothetical protein
MHTKGTETNKGLKTQNFNEVIKMKDMKGWPFEPLDGGIHPMGGGGGIPPDGTPD